MAKMKLYQMTEKLYTRGALSGKHLSQIVEGGFAVVTLTHQSVPAIQAELGERYHHAPMKDSKLTVENLDAAQRAITQVVLEILAGRKVIVHCQGGRNRAPFIAAVVLHTVYGYTGPEALERVRRIRPGCIVNPYFEACLEVLA